MSAARADPAVEGTPDAPARRCAVIVNPTKVSEGFAGLAREALGGDGWRDTVWLETRADDPGQGMARQALDAGVDLVIAAGGDGTVRAVADGLACSGVPLGVVAAGTANLLALNLDLPTREREALRVATTGRVRTIDLIKISVDGGPGRHFAVMAGAGLDAMIMDETDPELKSRIGTAAYFVAAGKALGRLPMKASIEVDRHRPRRRRAMLILVANVGKVPPNIRLVPDARPDDGQLEVLIASPRSPLDWLKVIGRLIGRRERAEKPLEIMPGTRVRVRLSKADDYQLDGDVAGRFTTMTAEVVPGALTVVCSP